MSKTVAIELIISHVNGYVNLCGTGTNVINSVGYYLLLVDILTRAHDGSKYLISVTSMWSMLEMKNIYLEYIKDRDNPPTRRRKNKWIIITKMSAIIISFSTVKGNLSNILPFLYLKDSVSDNLPHQINLITFALSTYIDLFFIN